MARKSFQTSISTQTLENIENQIIDTASESVEEIIEPLYKELKIKAINFLKIVNECQEKIQTIEAMMLSQKKLRDQIRAELGVTGRFLSKYETDEYKKNREELNNKLRDQEVEKMYKAAFQFHDDLNAALGKKVKTIILLEGENGNPILFDTSMTEIFDNNVLSYGETSKTARLTARFKVNADKMIQAGINAINRDDLKLNDKLNIEGLNESYKTVLYRYDTYDRLVLWLYPKNVWNWSKISARGDIAEAYSMFFLTDAKYNFDKEREENIHHFMLEGVANVDNISGLLQGDVSNGEYEYAIKSADASYMSIVQIIPLAEKIVNPKKNGVSNIADLEKYKKNLQKKKSKIRNPIYNALDHIISDNIQEVINEINLDKI